MALTENPGRKKHYSILKKKKFGNKLFDVGSQPYFSSSFLLQAHNPGQFIGNSRGKVFCYNFGRTSVVSSCHTGTLLYKFTVKQQHLFTLKQTNAITPQMGSCPVVSTHSCIWF